MEASSHMSFIFIDTAVVYSVETVSHCNHTLHDKPEAHSITESIFCSIHSLTSTLYSVTLIRFRFLLSMKLFFPLVIHGLFQSNSISSTVTIQGVTGGKDQTSGECSLGHTIPI
jgi:hypothetical protein